uniref:Uncharacterized protein n=1 Tax=viral metagenome TaxID=1070528 RepID=A0A6M3KKE2_9ZZZZ
MASRRETTYKVVEIISIGASQQGEFIVDGAEGLSKEAALNYVARLRDANPARRYSVKADSLPAWAYSSRFSFKKGY